jgi:hypothetical protein
VQFEQVVPVRPFVDVPASQAKHTRWLDVSLMLLASVAQPPPRDVRPAEQFAQTGPRLPQPEPLQPNCPAVHIRGHADAAAVAETELEGADDSEPDAVALDDAVAVEVDDAVDVSDLVVEVVGDGVDELEVVMLGVGVNDSVMVGDGVTVGDGELCASAAPTTAAARSSARSAPAARGAAWRDIGCGRAREMRLFGVCGPVLAGIGGGERRRGRRSRQRRACHKILPRARRAYYTAGPKSNLIRPPTHTACRPAAARASRARAPRSI